MVVVCSDVISYSFLVITEKNDEPSNNRQFPGRDWSPVLLVLSTTRQHNTWAVHGEIVSRFCNNLTAFSSSGDERLQMEPKSKLQCNVCANGAFVFRMNNEFEITSLLLFRQCFHQTFLLENRLVFPFHFIVITTPICATEYIVRYIRL
jgi:hypothetical protein